MLNKGEMATYQMADRMREAEQARLANEVWATRPRGVPRTVRATAMLTRMFHPVWQAAASLRTIGHVASHRVV